MPYLTKKPCPECGKLDYIGALRMCPDCVRKHSTPAPAPTVKRGQVYGKRYFRRYRGQIENSPHTHAELEKW